MHWLYDFLHNMFMALLIFALGNFNIGATKPIFLDSGSPRGGSGEGVRACVTGHGLLSLYSSYTKFKLVRKPIFFVSNIDLCRAMLPNYLKTYSSGLCQIKTLAKPFKK